MKTHTPNAQGERRVLVEPARLRAHRRRDGVDHALRAQPRSRSRRPGADLLRIDPSAFERSTDRIDFSRWNSQGTRTNPDTGETETVTVYARPSGMLRLKDSWWSRSKPSAQATTQRGKGLVALVDFEEQRVTQMLELDELQAAVAWPPYPTTTHAWPWAARASIATIRATVRAW